MTTPRYTTVDDFMEWAHDEIVAEAPLIEQALNASEMAIDNELGRKMVVAGDASPRVYAPRHHSRILWVDDFTTITSIVEDGTTVPADAWQAEPLNNLSASGETMPYYKIRRVDGGYWYASNGKATLTVTAAWGWQAIPPEIVTACLILAKDILLNREVKLGLAGISAEGGVAIRRNPTVIASINHYQRVEMVPG